MKIKVGIFFGGPSREKELSFLEGRMVYEHLNKSLFEAIPIFVDAMQQFHLAKPIHLYQTEQLKTLPSLDAESFPTLINFAFLCLHGPFGEDGQIQTLLETLRIPYSGSSLQANELGINTILQRNFLTEKGFDCPKSIVLKRRDWNTTQAAAILEDTREKIGDRLYIWPTRQNSDIGASFIDVGKGLKDFQIAVEKAFNITAKDPSREEEEIIIEASPYGQSFHCTIFSKDDGQLIALPTVEKQEEGAFEFLSEEKSNLVGLHCKKVFEVLSANAYASIEGIIDPKGVIYLSHFSGAPNLTFFFRQMATINLSASDSLTFLIRSALQERILEKPEEAAYGALLELLEDHLTAFSQYTAQLKKVAVVFGGQSAERHQSLKTSQFILGQLGSSGKYLPIPIYLAVGENQNLSPYQVPLTLAQSQDIDKIGKQVVQPDTLPKFEELKKTCQSITEKFTTGQQANNPKYTSLDQLAKSVDGVFIAMHGRPGSDGQIQMQLEAKKIPYNGSDVKTSSVVIDRFRCLQTLKRNGLNTPEQTVGKKVDYEQEAEEYYQRIESRINYPILAKPLDVAHSPAHIIVNNRTELEAYVRLSFRPEGQLGAEARRTLELSRDLSFPRMNEILFESVSASNSEHWSVSIGLLTKTDEEGVFQWELFDLFSPNEVAGRAELTSKIKEEIEKAARILNLKDYAQIIADVCRNENGEIEVIIKDVYSLPFLSHNQGFLLQAQANGFTPNEITEDLFSSIYPQPNTPFIVEEIAVEQKETSTEAIFEAEAVDMVKKSSALEETSLEEVRPNEDPVFPPESEVSQLHFANETNSMSTNQNLVKEKIQKWLGEAARFLRSPYFLKNFAALLGFLVFFFLLIRFWLNIYTNHGESLQVHDYTGMHLDEAIQKAKSRSFKVVVSDSIYLVDREPFTVLEQEPKPFSRVKENRRIYIIITKQTPDEVTLPNLVGSYDYDQYSRKLKLLDLKPTIVDREFSNRLEENTILHFFYKGQKITDADLRNAIKVPKGSVLEFVVTERTTNNVPIPNLICKNYKAASFQITGHQLNVGKIYGNVSDRDRAYVWKQEPAYESGRYIRMGTQINIYLTDSRPASCPDEPDPSNIDINDTEEDTNSN